MRVCAGLFTAGVRVLKGLGRPSLVLASPCSNMAAATLAHLPEVEQLTPRVTRVLGCNPGPFTLQGTNCYLLGSGPRKILVDTGEKENAQFLVNLRKTLNETGCNIQEVLITHWHHDHTGGIQGIHKDVVKGPLKVTKMRQVKGTDDDLGELEYTYVDDGHVFKADGVTLRAMYTPGHADDHMSLWMEEENALFSGDTVLGEGTAVFEDLYDYMKSLKKLLSLNARVVYPAHGAVVNDPETHISMYIQHRNQREEQIFTALKSAEKPLDLDDIVRAVYEPVYGELPAALFKGAQNNVNHHLQKLIKEQKIASVGEEKQYQVIQSNL